MDWFRWHHGSVTDPKFQLVAKKADVTLPDVLAVWAYVLEAASQAEERGCIGNIDAEALDALFRFPDSDTRTARILAVFEERGLTKAGRIYSWEKRQPKREREDNASAERQRAFRARQSQVTPSNATVSQKTPRGEERREEKKREKTTPPLSPKGEPEGFAEFYAAYPRKEGRARAAQAFARVDVPLQALLQALDAHKQTEQWSKDGGKFIPLPASWLNGRRWEDQLRPADGTPSHNLNSRSAVESEGMARGVVQYGGARGAESFYERDLRLKRQRWEEMTGRKWGDNASGSLVIDVHSEVVHEAGKGEQL